MASNRQCSLLISLARRQDVLFLTVYKAWGNDAAKIGPAWVGPFSSPPDSDCCRGHSTPAMRKSLPVARILVATPAGLSVTSEMIARLMSHHDLNVSRTTSTAVAPVHTHAAHGESRRSDAYRRAHVIAWHWQASSFRDLRACIDLRRYAALFSSLISLP